MNTVSKLLIFIFCFNIFCIGQTNNFNVENFQYISPLPGSGLHNPETNIIIRQGEVLNSFDLNDTTLITVTGDSSGSHSGSLYLTPDSKTIVFQPDIIFTNGELVSVSLRSGLTIASGGNVDSLHFVFRISKNPVEVPNSAANVINRNRVQQKSHFSKISFSTSSDISLLTLTDYPTISVSNTNAPQEGYYFLSLNEFPNYFLTIVNNRGIPIYVKKDKNFVYDFKIQKNGLLTYYDRSSFKFFEMDSLYQVIDSFYCGNGYVTDFHELQVLPNGNAFVLSYDQQRVNMDTVIAGGRNDAIVVGNVIQEIDNSKRVIWQWRSWDHLKITDAADSYDLIQNQSTGAPIIEYCHINSIDVVDDNDIIFSLKHFNEVEGIDRKTGNIKWRLGGKENQFRNIQIGFIYQHDARFIGDNKISVFDNGNFSRQESKVVIYKIDTTTHTATLIRELFHNPSVWGKNMGNVQQTENNNFIVGWGNTGTPYYITEYDSAGNLSNDLRFTGNGVTYSYRAFKFPWRTKVFTTEKDSVIFQNTAVGSQSVQSIKISNNTSASREISGYYNKDGVFTITNNFPISISPNGSISLDFRFIASDTQEIIDTLYLVSKSADEMIALPIILIGNQGITAVENENLNLPVDFRLEQNYPNPFNPSTIITYSIPVESIVKIKVYNLLGEEIRELVNGKINSGNHSVKWNAQGLSSGIYFYRIEAASTKGKRNFSITKKMLLLK